jgi:hypothetical protein
LSVIPVTVGVVPQVEDQATTMRLPLPVAGIVQVVAGNTTGPQVVACTRLIWDQLFTATATPPAGAAAPKVAVHMEDAPEARLVGEQVRLEIVGNAVNTLSA